MTDPRKAAFEPYLRCLADKMGLRDWSVGIAEGVPDNANHTAEAQCRYGRKVLWVFLSEDFLGNSERTQRATLCHELIHAHMAPMHQLLIRELGDGGPFEAYRMLMEYAVDGMAEEWARSLPLPSEVKPAEVVATA